MRPLVLYIATSLDGYIARPSGAFDWLFSDQDYGYTEFFAGVDTVLMGRKTYDQALGFGEYPYKGTRGVVFSRTPRAPDTNVTFVSGDLASFVSELKRGPGKDIWLVGGGEIVAECVRHDLVDDFRLFVHPLILGEGIPLFAPGLPERPLQFVRSQSFDSGLVEVSYQRAR
jgi:dihydrofolate reductase